MSKKLSVAEFGEIGKERGEKNEQFLSEVSKVSFFLNQPCTVSSENNVLESESQKLDYVVEDKGAVSSNVPILQVSTKQY